jgi:hypothetical protein
MPEETDSEGGCLPNILPTYIFFQCLELAFAALDLKHFVFLNVVLNQKILMKHEIYRAFDLYWYAESEMV